MAAMPRAYIIAGPNGAGKTTFARGFLPDDAGCTTFINADLIAAGLSPFRPEAAELRAMRLMVEAMRECVAARRDFAIETTLSGRSYVTLIRSWKAAGYSVKIIFLKLPSVEEAIARVRQRVSLGGHHVPDDVVRRRFGQGWTNFEALYRPLVDAWAVYDSSGPFPSPISEGCTP
jgi:predicted ABC-type ATPase